MEKLNEINASNFASLCPLVTSGVFEKEEDKDETTVVAISAKVPPSMTAAEFTKISLRVCENQCQHYDIILFGATIKKRGCSPTGISTLKKSTILAKVTK
jgi:hypothetical protein